MRYAMMWPRYAAWWDEMVITASRVHEFERAAAKIIAGKPRYAEVETATGVPWYAVGLIHLREGDCNFGTYLGNGQSLNHETTIVPRGRGPFRGANPFLDGAIDALKLDGLTSVKDWNLEKILYWEEVFNGSGYTDRGLPSPYLFGGTSIQKPGKYTADHVFNPHVWDTQPGVAPVLATLPRLDPSIKFVRETTEIGA